jgi:CubicO group peptidase (beta-lactamase class C family)
MSIKAQRKVAIYDKLHLKHLCFISNQPEHDACSPQIRQPPSHDSGYLQSNTSAIPDVSLDIIENKEILYTASLGYANIESKTSCDSDMTFVLDSLSKGKTAAPVASLHDDGAIPSWDTRLKTILPECHGGDISDEIATST